MANPIPEEKKRKLDSLFDAFSIVAEGTYVYLCAMEYDYSRWSQSAVDAFGLPDEYMYGAGDIWEEHIHPEDRESYHNSIDAIFSGSDSGHDMQYRARRRDGEYDVCTCKGIVLRNEDGSPEYFGGAIRNHGVQSHLDTLIGLRNQYGFFEDIGHNLVKNIHTNIAMIGISRFVEINEIYGYMFGNQVLQRFGRFLYDHVGNSGSVYRLDGTKFAIITTTQSVDELKKSYKDLRKRFKNECEIDGNRIVLDLNAGVISVDNFAVDEQTVFTCLNFAYGESKNRGDGEMVEFSEKLTEDSRSHIEKLHAIRASIPQDFKGFMLYYQPVVSAENEALIGAEALIRWQSKKYGLVMPDSFIPFLERDSLFPELGRWIIWKALTDSKNVLQYVPDFVINVNLSYAQLLKPDFTDMVLDLLKETDYPADHLCLEITERCRILEMDLLKNVVIKLKSAGVKFALDDYGTGFSSIGLLKNLDFDTIKIDRSFVLEIENNETDRQLVGSISDTAAIFGANVCVEGIETPEMRDILKHYQVRSFQGYYYSRPIDFDSFMAWIKEKNK